MLLRATVVHYEMMTRKHVEAGLLANGLAQNIESINRQQIFGDFVFIDDVALYMRCVDELQRSTGCKITVEVGG